MKRTLLRIVKAALAVVAVAVIALVVYVWRQTAAYDASVATHYDIPFTAVHRSADPAVVARGAHLASSLGECIVCHGANLGGGRVEEMGPVGRIVYPNITAGKNGALARYSDEELARLLRHGVKRDGTTVRLMPVGEFYWWPDEDRDAVISYLRTLAPVDGAPPVVEFTAMAKVLDRIDSMPIDVARRVDHTITRPRVEPAPTVEYGAQLAIACSGCHGPHFSGGPITGAPPDFPPPKNLTSDATGLGAWSFEDFQSTLRTGVDKDGHKLSTFMPAAAFGNMSDVELRALWAYLRSLPPMPYGSR